MTESVRTPYGRTYGRTNIDFFGPPYTLRGKKCGSDPGALQNTTLETFHNARVAQDFAKIISYESSHEAETENDCFGDINNPPSFMRLFLANQRSQFLILFFANLKSKIPIGWF